MELTDSRNNGPRASGKGAVNKDSTVMKYFFLQRTVELIDRSFPDDGLIEEPNYTKKEKFTKVSDIEGKF